MSETKHTPGPIKYHAKLSGSENHKGFWISNATGWKVAEVMPIDPDGIGGEKLARLMTAAPDLLKEMKRFLTVIEYVECNYNSTVWESATKGTGIATSNAYRAAIAKAEGEE